MLIQLFVNVQGKMYAIGKTMKNPKTIYCGCDYDPERHTVDWTTCGLDFRKNEKRQVNVCAVLLCFRVCPFRLAVCCVHK